MSSILRYLMRNSLSGEDKQEREGKNRGDSDREDERDDDDNDDDDNDDGAPPAAETQQPFPLGASMERVDTATAESLKTLLLDDDGEAHPRATTTTSTSDTRPGFPDGEETEPEPSLLPTSSNPLHLPPRPVLAEIQTDILEWLCYVCLMQRDPELIRAEVDVLETFLRQANLHNLDLLSSTSQSQIGLRLRLTSFHASLCGGIVGTAAGAAVGAATPSGGEDEGGKELTARDWETLHHEFVNLEKQFRTSSSSSRGTARRKRDAQVVQGLFKLMGVQHALSLLEADFLLILKERPRNVRLDAREALEQYFRELEQVYKNQVPEELEICFPDQAPTSSRGIDRVLQQVRQLVSEGPFSLGVLQEKVQRLLLDWSSRYIDPPVLVQLGYRGIVLPEAAATPTNNTTAASTSAGGGYHDDDIIAGDMSSFGADGMDSDDDDLIMGGADTRQTTTALFQGAKQPRRRRFSRSTSTSIDPPMTSEPDEDTAKPKEEKRIQVISKVVPRNVKQPRKFSNENKKVVPPPPAKKHSFSEGKQECDDSDTEYDEEPLQQQPQPVEARLEQPSGSNNNNASVESSDKEEEDDQLETQRPLTHMELDGNANAKEGEMLDEESDDSTQLFTASDMQKEQNHPPSTSRRKKRERDSARKAATRNREYLLENPDETKEGSVESEDDRPRGQQKTSWEKQLDSSGDEEELDAHRRSRRRKQPVEHQVESLSFDEEDDAKPPARTKRQRQSTSSIEDGGYDDDVGEQAKRPAHPEQPPSRKPHQSLSIDVEGDTMPPARTRRRRQPSPSLTEDDDEQVKRPAQPEQKPRRRKTYRRLSFTDDEEEDVQIVETPHGTGLLSGRSKSLFTNDEVDAIREGVARYGAGNWTKIKTGSNGRLANRTTVQIKDKYRNLFRTYQL